MEMCEIVMERKGSVFWHVEGVELMRGYENWFVFFFEQKKACEIA